MKQYYEVLFLSYRPRTECSISQFFKKNCTQSIFRTINRGLLAKPFSCLSTPGSDVHERLKTNRTAFKIARETTDCSNSAVYPDPTDRPWVSKDALSFFSRFMFVTFKSLLNKEMVEGLHFNLLIFHLYFPHWTLSKTANFGTRTGSVLLRVISVLLRVNRAKNPL